MSPPFLNAELLIFKPNSITGKLLSILSEIQAFKQDYEPCNLLIEIMKKKTWTDSNVNDLSQLK